MTYKKQLEKRVLAGLLAGAALWLGMPAALAASGAVPNTQLPQGGHFIAGGIDTSIVDHQNGQMTITQGSQNAVIQWGGGFNVGANATVNFEGPANGYNTLNYDASGNMSQIYGAINANNKGNIYIVNPAGVEISSSAQINVGSLYVSNRDLSEKIYEGMNEPTDMAAFVQGGTTTDAALMSLGNINADHVTFDGRRIVIDTERLKTDDAKMGKGNIHVRTTDAGQVVLGYDGYDESSNKYGETKDASELASVTDEKGNAITTDLYGYMWVEDIEQLQAVNTSGQYALRNSIDATATQDWADSSGKGFVSIGSDGEGNSFTGKFDGLDYNIFNLNIDRAGGSNVGLFGVVGNGAVIRNVTLVGGSIKGRDNVGALAGSVQGSAQISNIMNSASVTGDYNVGGIVGSAENSVFENLVNTGTVIGHKKSTEEPISNTGGLIGSLTGGTLSGTSYNLGGVTGDGYNVGGLVGKASDAALGDGTNLIYNRLNVSGAYNVGGIVGSMTNTTVKNAENSGNVTAKGHMNGTYTYHSAHYASGGTTTADVYIANAGGIAGKSDSTGEKKSEIKNVQNSGDVSSSTAEENSYTYYTAGNVGGIVGSAVDTSISDATNEENDIRGAHNVGGIAGYFSGKGTITTGINSGGDILATGARYGSSFVKEWVRTGDTGQEEAIIGNMGGIAGYMDGDGVYIVSGANRGTVHSQDIIGNTVLPVSEAANVGGIVGKIDRDKTLSKGDLGDKYQYAAVSNSYNTGDVRGYTAVGGVAGMMYNGEIAGSYNLGTINTTRKYGSDSTAYYTVNMGGIVGDTTENAKASALLYDVYNKGQIGDSGFNYASRHVGGIVGRLSGVVEKAYNTGAIYNGYNVVGGIAGWMSQGSITNSFNTGNITVNNQEKTTAGIQAGGIVGGASTGSVEISNVYNLGTIRGFQSGSASGYAVGGIVGAFIGDGSATVSNAYTTGNLYLNTWGSPSILGLGSIYGTNGNYNKQYITTVNTYYIKPADGLPFTDLSKFGNDNSNKAIAYADRHKKAQWEDFHFSSQAGGTVTIKDGEDWRIYDGVSLPILNAFLPNAEEYFSQSANMSGIDSIQYGTAYDPLLTIINANTNSNSLTFNWKNLGISNAAGLAVYGANLTLNDFMVSGGSGYFGGLIYSDGALAINATSEEVTGNVALGSASQLYGSSVTISADGNVTIYGNVTATGNGTKAENNPAIDNSGSISITGGSVDIYGQLTSAKKDAQTTVPGIDGKSEAWKPTSEDVSDYTKPMTDLGDRFGHTTDASAVNGNISITAEKNGTASEDGHVNVYYGHQQKGFINTAGNLTVSGFGDVYMDSDLSVGGNLGITSSGEMILDISNIGKVQKDNGTVTDSLRGLHTFLHHFDKNGGTDKGTISFTGIKGTAADAKITVDMWDDKNNEFNLTQYDSTDHKLITELDNLNFSVSGADEDKVTAKDYTYIWVSTGEQLAGIQQADSSFLGYNFALKNDIDANMVENYKAIGTGSTSGFNGTFDGRDHRIIGLKVGTLSNGTAQSNAGIFNTIGTNGKVEDLRVYSGTFSGTDNAGAVAGINKGTISNVTTFGNVVTAQGSGSSTVVDSKPVGAAGGIAGVNAGAISGISASDTVTADDAKVVDGNGNAILSAAGGIAGINAGDAKISDSSTNSAVNASAGSTYALGGIAGVNTSDGELSNVDSLGVTTGIYEVGSHNTAIGTQYSDNVGGIAGRNSGTISEAYNESIVSGRNNVGGILGKNTGKSVENVSNAARVTGEAASGETSDYVGGLVGSNSGSITNGRNNGEITGNRYVGGLVGENGSGSTLSNLINDEAASITGDNYVGGIAGRNYGTISANDKGLVNRGSITGQMYVGGVAGSNEEGGIIKNTISSIALHVKTDADHVAEGGDFPKYFGGVVGQNSGTINGATNESSVDVAADGATMVGGIIGENTGSGKLAGTIANEGFVSGKSDVGGIIGSNQNTEILNNDDKNDRLVVSNSGRVQAEKGGAAGIFYENTGAINNADLTNTGMVIGGTDSTSVTGGLFGTNSGDITNSTLTNNGTVYGGGTVGGLIGENTGDISTSSLINSVNGKVIGLNNVGGLIGVNTGPITGGRDEKDGYYKYQIYNNGTIQVGTWTDSDQDGIIDTGEFKPAAGENIGGLFGTNSEDVTAAYNTGAIDAAYSENVGGIAGTNTGTLDQVFNTVITGVDDKGSNVYGSITGSTSVGGIVGSNTGTVSNAYNTSDIIGTDTIGGAIAGTNNGTISNVYGTGSGNLVNTGTEADHVYQNSKDGFGEGGSKIDTDGSKHTSEDYFWRQYGTNNPLLKVFLTTVKYDASKNNQNLVYNGKDQTLDVTGNGFTAADDFAAHNNVSGGLIYHNVAGEHKNAGTYMDNLWSEQIKAGSKDDTFNPNNLGYDVQSVEYDIGKAQITINLDTVDRVYGNTTPIEGNGYGFSYGFSNVYEDAKDTLSEELKGNLTLGDVAVADDTALRDETHTNDANGDYTWTGTVSMGNYLDGTSLSKNYEFVHPDGTVQSGTSITTTGDSNVEKATITVDLIDVNRTYGNAAINKTDTNKNGDYGVANIEGVTNGDSYTAGNFNVTVKDGDDGALTGNSTGRVTNDANTEGTSYTYTGTVTGTDDRLNKNYNIVVKDSENNTGTGKSYVHKADLTIYLDTVNRTYGDTAFTNGTNYGISTTSELVNGDSGLSLSNKAVVDAVNHDGALVTSGDEVRTNNANKAGESYTWTVDNLESSFSGVDNLFQNYDVKIEAGKSTVAKKKLSVGDVTASIIYGNQGGEGFKITSNGKLDGIAYNDDVSLKDSVDVDSIKIEENSAYANKKGDRTTADVGTYTDSLSYSGLELDGAAAGNYYIDGNASGTINVTKANLTVDINDVDTIYGTAFDETKYGYGISGITNSDKEDSLRGTIDNAANGYVNTGMDDNGRTQDANGNYELKFSKELGNDTLKNYAITVNNGKATIAQKQLTVSDIVASIIYGNQKGEGFQITSGGELEGIAYADDNVSLKDSVDASGIEIVEGSAYDQNRDGRTTADVGTYENSLSYSGLELTGKDAGNYYIDGSASGTIEVTKANLTVDINDVHTTYGTEFNTRDYGYTFGQGEVVNGDDEDSLKNAINAAAGGYINTGMDDNGRTQDANGDYELKFSNGLGDETLKNYAITVNNGEATIAQKKLTVSDIVASIIYGDQGNKGFQITSDGKLEGIAYEDDDVSLSGSGNVSNIKIVEGSEYANNKKNRDTANVGTYENSLSYSGLELTGDDSGNYYIDGSASGTIKVNKADLTIAIGNAETTYGTAFTPSEDYHYTVGGIVNGDSTNSLTEEIDKATGGYRNNGEGTEGKATNNAGNYDLVFNNDLVNKDVLQNYNITSVAKGTATVNKANLNITINDVNTTYGTAFNTGDYGYTFGQGEVVNGDDEDSLKNAINAAAGGYINTGAGTDGHATQDAGDGYSLSFADTVDKNILNNYTVAVTNGTSTVSKAEIAVSADSHQIYVGAPEPTYTGTTIEDLLVNGDSLNGTSYGYGPQGPVDTNQSGKTEIGIHFGDTYFGSESGTDWSSAWEGFKNYSVTFTPGTLTVEGMPSDMPEISDGEKWNSLLHKAPWSRERNFRERKANIHFIAGGMSY